MFERMPVRERLRFAVNAVMTAQFKVTRMEDNAANVAIIGVENACSVDRRGEEKKQEWLRLEEQSMGLIESVRGSIQSLLTLGPVSSGAWEDCLQSERIFRDFTLPLGLPGKVQR